MRNLLNECMPWLTWQTGLIVALVTIGLVVCTGLPTWSILVGATPLLIVAACLLPCLIPLVFWRKNKNKAIEPVGVKTE